MSGNNIAPDVTYMALDVLRLLRPHRLLGARKLRLGRFFDGGYVMVDRFDQVEAAYSLGINDDVSWDLDIAALGIPVFQYDHTIEGLPEEHPLFHWEPRCIADRVDEAERLETLENLVERNGHANAQNLLLKCDIEGAEWRLLAITPNSVLRKFSQIVIEIHNMAFLTETQHANNVRRAILNLTASYRVVHVHANNFAPWIVAGGVPIPNVLELTLMRNDMGEMVVSDEIFPTPLDMPCHSHHADLYLGRFAYD